MPTEISGSTGVDKIQSDAIETGDMPAGSVLQVVQNALNPSSYTTATDSWTTIIDMDVTITPSSASSKVLVTFNCGGVVVANTANTDDISIRIKRGATVIRELGRYGFNRNNDYSSLPIFLTYMDSPNTTSSTTYTLEMKVDQSGGQLHLNRGATTNGGVTIAQEIAG